MLGSPGERPSYGGQKPGSAVRLHKEKPPSKIKFKTTAELDNKTTAQVGTTRSNTYHTNVWKPCKT